MNNIFWFCTYIGNAILNIRNNILKSKIIKINPIHILVLSWVLMVLHIPFIFIISILIIGFFLRLITDTKRIFLSVRGFIITGIYYWFMISLLVVILMMKIIDFKRFVFIPICGYLICAVLWWFYSLIANNKVASTANEILSAIFGILILIKDTYIAMMPDSILELKDNLGYTYEKSIEMISGIIFSPLLAINIIALLLCVLKGYWIEKYNDNQDVGYEYTEHKEIEDTEN